MMYAFNSGNQPVLDLDLKVMHDQLLLAAGSNDIQCLYSILINEENVENYIQLSAQNPTTINLLFQCLSILDNLEHTQPLITKILGHIYTYCGEHLDWNAKAFIARYTGMNEEQLNNLLHTSNCLFYYSDGAKRQKLEPYLNKENKTELADTQAIFSKKHELDPGEPSSLAKRQRVKPSPPSHKREVPFESSISVEQASKRKR